ncbi:hypothetical protein [Neobacillus terrae]
MKDLIPYQNNIRLKAKLIYLSPLDYREQAASVKCRIRIVNWQ